MVRVFFFVCAVYFSVWIFLLKDTIMYIFIDWEIKGTPFYSWTETGVYVRVSMWLLCGTIFND